MREILIFMVSLSLKLGINQYTLKLTFNGGFMHPRKEFTSPLIFMHKLNLLTLVIILLIVTKILI